MKNQFFLLLALFFLEIAVIAIFILYASANHPGWLPYIIVTGIFLFILTFIFILVIRPLLVKRRMKSILSSGAEATAEVLQDGIRQMSEYMKGINYQGPEILFPMAVRLFPADGSPPAETIMKYRIIHAHLLKPGMTVAVRYDPAEKSVVYIADSPEDLLRKNPSLKNRINENRAELLKRLGR